MLICMLQPPRTASPSSPYRPTESPMYRSAGFSRLLVSFRVPTNSTTHSRKRDSAVTDVWNFNVLRGRVYFRTPPLPLPLPLPLPVGRRYWMPCIFRALSPSCKPRETFSALLSCRSSQCVATLVTFIVSQPVTSLPRRPPCVLNPGAMMCHSAAVADKPVSISSVLINLSDPAPGAGQRRKINQLAARSRERERRIRAPWEG
jgi:hypothetical protein